jgi:hypothetical protein
MDMMYSPYRELGQECRCEIVDRSVFRVIDAGIIFICAVASPESVIMSYAAHGMIHCVMRRSIYRHLLTAIVRVSVRDVCADFFDRAFVARRLNQEKVM